jgi:hypothetical protein
MSPTGIKHIVESLSSSQRNALRVLLAVEDGPALLRRELGIAKVEPLKEATRKTGLARAGRTIDLFHNHKRHAAADLKR